MLRAYSMEMGRDWEEALPWLMVAAREAALVGFSPTCDTLCMALWLS